MYIGIPLLQNTIKISHYQSDIASVTESFYIFQHVEQYHGTSITVICYAASLDPYCYVDSFGEIL